MNEREFCAGFTPTWGTVDGKNCRTFEMDDDRFELGGSEEGDAWLDTSPAAAGQRRYVRDSARHIVNNELVPPGPAHYRAASGRSARFAASGHFVAIT